MNSLKLFSQIPMIKSCQYNEKLPQISTTDLVVKLEALTH